jgi:outer membrane assembly lipoprotein YfiO
MKRIRNEVLSRFPARELLLVGAVACFAGCSSSSPSSSSSFLPSLPSLPWSGSKTDANASAESLYREGNQLLANKKYAQAIDRYQKLRSDFPFAPEVVGAEMKLGEAYYLNKQYTEAVEALKEFEAMHPNNENIPYALYLAGMAHFDQFSSADRDQKNTEIAKGFFERVVNNYPKSEYAPKAKDKLAKCLDYLAEHEYDIASYYMREKKYAAARDRFEGIVRRYRTSSVAPKALFNLGEAYRLEKNNVKAALAFEALTQYYPNDPLAKSARTQLTQLAQEKMDPLDALLKQERRAATTAVAETKKPEPAKDAPRTAKTEVVNEKPGDEKGLLSRMVDKINPFSSSSPAPDKETEKKAPAANTAKTVSPQSSQLIGSIDESLKRRAVEAGAQAKTDPAPPKPDLPTIAEAPLPSTPQASATLSAIDGKLEKKGAATAALPPTPEAAPILKQPIDEKALASSSSKSRPVDTGVLISNIDSKLKRQGIDPAAEEVKIAAPVADKPIVTAKPKAAPEKALEPRLPEEKSPLFLAPQDVRVQDKPAEVASTPVEKTAAPVAPSLPELAVKGPPQPAKDKPADTKTAAKAKSSEEDEDVENKSAFDQIKEDLGRIGKILNPFSW